MPLKALIPKHFDGSREQSHNSAEYSIDRVVWPIITADFRAQYGVFLRTLLSLPVAAPDAKMSSRLEINKPRWLHVPATTFNCESPCPSGRGLFAFGAIARMPARSPCTSISKPSSFGVSTIAEISALSMSADFRRAASGPC